MELIKQYLEIRDPHKMIEFRDRIYDTNQFLKGQLEIGGRVIEFLHTAEINIESQVSEPVVNGIGEIIHSHTQRSKTLTMTIALDNNEVYMTFNKIGNLIRMQTEYVKGIFQILFFDPHPYSSETDYLTASVVLNVIEVSQN